MATPRLSFEEYGILMAYAASTRATCRRRMVGCALFGKNKVVVATGYNGAPSGAPQCDEVGCLIEDGRCKRVSHAEKNSLLFSKGRDLSDGYAFTTISPCSDCFQLLLDNGIRNFFYLDGYRLETIQEMADKAKKDFKIKIQKLDLDFPRLLQKTLDFHQSPGGLLISRNKLRVEEDISEMMDH